MKPITKEEFEDKTKNHTFAGHFDEEREVYISVLYDGMHNILVALTDVSQCDTVESWGENVKYYETDELSEKLFHRIIEENLEGV